MAVFPLRPDDFVAQFIGVAVFISAESHERLTRGDRADPGPEAAFFPVAFDAPALFEEGLLQDVFGVFRRAADAAGKIVDRRLESSIKLLQRLRIPSAGFR